MRALRTLATSTAAILVFGLTGCNVAATGPVVSDERPIEAVTNLVIDASGDVTIAEGDPALVIHAKQAVLDQLTSEVVGDTLTLGSSAGLLGLPVDGVRYELTLPNLETIDLNGSGTVDSALATNGTLTITLDGSGEIRFSAIDAERVDVRVSGSGEVSLTGDVVELAIDVTGSGRMNAADLEAHEAKVKVSGSGSVAVAARDELLVAISGSGNVEYSGDPDLETAITGSGRVSRTED